MSKEDPESGETKLSDKIKHVLTEARTVLPGAQALLGFQFIAVLIDSFDRLPTELKYVHLVSLALIALSTVLLMMPAAFHRIVERGEDSERFHEFANRAVLAAMIPLALGLAGDLIVVVQKVTNSSGLAIAAAALMLIFFFGLWFGFSLYRRNERVAARQPA